MKRLYVCIKSRGHKKYTDDIIQLIQNNERYSHAPHEDSIATVERAGGVDSVDRGHFADVVLPGP